MSKEAVRLEPFSFPKPTYHALSQAITEAVDSTRDTAHGQMRSDTVDHLKDQLFLSPRLTQWSQQGGEFRLFTEKEDICVSITDKKVWLTKGIRNYDIMNGVSASTIYKSLEEAQAIVQPAVPKNISEAEQEEYFADQNVTGADLDAALRDAPNLYNHDDDEETEIEDLFPKVNPAPGGSSEEEDEELLAEIEGDAPDTVEPGTIAVAELEKVEAKAYQVHPSAPIVVEKFGVNAGVEPGGYVSKINRKAAAETNQVNIEYDDSKYLKDKDPVKDCPTLEVTRVIAHLKSLQGNILNIVEASFSDQEQRKAVKTLINKAFRGKMNNLGAGWSQTDED